MEIRLLLDHREDLIAERTRAMNRLRWHLLQLCPELEARLPNGGLTRQVVQERIATRLRNIRDDPRARVARDQLRHICTLSSQINELERELGTLVAAHRPALLAEQGCGVLTAATLIGRTAGAERFPTDAHFARQTGTAPIPASSGQVVRHRLHRGGDRRLNSALHMIAITKARLDPQTKAYLERKRAEGKTKREALRCLKRHLARRVHHLLSMPAVGPDPS